MAQVVSDYPQAIQFIEDIKRRECFIPHQQMPEPLASAPPIPYLGLGLASEYQYFKETQQWRREFQVFVSGWQTLDGVMIITGEDDFDADIRVSITARTERALCDLLTSFPRDQVGFLYYSGEWMKKTLTQYLDGQEMPAREGYFCTQETFTPWENREARRLTEAEYDLVSRCWSREVFEELIQGNYGVHASVEQGDLKGVCFHWPMADWRSEVHGLQAYGESITPYAESAFSSATKEVLSQGRVATCTANLSSENEFLAMLLRLGYTPFYRVLSYRGVRRGGGPYTVVDRREVLGARPPVSRIQREGYRPGCIGGKKDPILLEFRDLDSLKARLERSQIVVEGLLLVLRAICDGLAVDKLLYTPEFLGTTQGLDLLRIVHAQQIPHYQISQGLMGAVTSTRPVPGVMASIWCHLLDTRDLHLPFMRSLLITDCLSNPDNLGMILRSADASGIDGVVVLGEGASPFHKNCIRSARGAMGRIPIYTSQSSEELLSTLRASQVHVLGASARATTELYQAFSSEPIAMIVGNESHGIRPEVLRHCTQIVKIPMAPGQSSLNVSVATGIMLWEYVRQKKS